MNRAPADPHLIAVGAYAETLHSCGVPRWQAAQKASRAIPRPHPTPRPEPARAAVRVSGERRYLVAPRGPDTGTLALHDITGSTR